MTPDQLTELARGYQSARIFLSAVELGLLSALAEGPADAEALARACRTKTEPTRRVLDALCGLDVLVKTGERYELEAGIRDVFDPASDHYQVDMFRHHARLWDSWSRLSGIAGREPEPDAEEGERRDFIRAMANIGRGSARELAAAVDLSKARRLLDVGGGPGVYAITLAEAHPHLEAVVFDRAEVLEIAKEFIADSSAAGRVSTTPGDAVTDDFGTGYDAVLMSNFIHVFGADLNKEIFRKASHALNPGGQLIVKDFLIDETRTRPEFSAIFSINMLVGTESGDVYTEGEIRAWMEEADFGDMETRHLARHSAVIVGRKP